MDKIKKLNGEELGKVIGGGGDMSYALQYLVCPSCGLQVARDLHTPIISNTYYSQNGDERTVPSCTLYCRGCGYTVGAGYFAGEKDI